MGGITSQEQAEVIAEYAKVFAEDKPKSFFKSEIVYQGSGNAKRYYHQKRCVLVAKKVKPEGNILKVLSSLPLAKYKPQCNDIL